MVVIILEKVPASVRGELTRWLLELKTGVFVGNVSGAVRDALWLQVCSKMKGGAGMLLHNTANEQGYAIRLHGKTARQIENLDGLLLMRIPAVDKPEGQPEAPQL
ncbi:MAG: type I-E CRISPR-associated endoribonuclease Cas2 [Acidobacteria bacterium]|nr:type I-E CRISPR-associated endoribonuclease Cas2 [Acidobacteriota bacterium]